MARRKTVTTVEADENDAELQTPAGGAGLIEDDPDSRVETDIVDELKRLGGDEGIKWSVYRISGKPGEAGGWCADYTSGELSLQGIRDTFGGGRYKIQGTKLSGGQYVAQRTINLIDLPKPAGAAGAGPAGGVDVAALATALRPAGDSGMLGLIMEMMKSNTQQMTALFQGLNKGESKQPSAMELVALIKALQPAKSDEKNSADLILEGIRLARELGGGGGGADWMDLARTGLEAIKPAIEAQAAARAAQPALAPPGQPAAPALPAPTTPQPAPAAAPTGDPMLQQLNWLRAQVALLVGQAAKHTAGKGGDPELYAEIMLDNLPPFITPEQLFERISAPDSLQQLASIDARVNQYLPWFTQFRQAVLDFFGDEETPDGAAGDEAPPAA